MKTTLQLEHQPHPSGATVVRALLKLQGEPPDASFRIPLNLSLVLDRSGSMHGEKLEAAKDAARQLVRRLSPDDRVSVVAYDDGVTTVARPSTGDAQVDLPRRIAGIQVGGSTNLSGGWLRGRDLVAQNLRDGGVNRVLLLTDGLANVGITDPTQLEGLCRTAAGQGIGTTTIGFGADYDEHLLRAMADAGSGNAYYIERPDQATDIFADELEGLLTLAAQNVTVDVRLADGTGTCVVHHEYPRAESPAGLRLELGDVYAREPRPLLLEFLLATPGQPGPVPVAELVVTAHVLTPAGGVERRTITLPITVDTAEGPRVDPDVRREMLLQEAAKARREALEAERSGDYEAGGRALREVAEKLSADPMSDQPDVAEEAADLRLMAERFEADRVDPMDAKYLYQRSSNIRRGRHSLSESISRSKRKVEPEEEA